MKINFPSWENYFDFVDVASSILMVGLATAFAVVGMSVVNDFPEVGGVVMLGAGYLLRGATLRWRES